MLVLGLNKEKEKNKTSPSVYFGTCMGFTGPYLFTAHIANHQPEYYMKPFYGGRNRYCCRLQVSEN